MARDDRYAWVTDGMFHEKLEEILGEQSGATLLAVPGLFEVAAEHFNNEVLEALEEEHPEEALRGVISTLAREKCVALLEDVCIMCRDDEPVEVLREAVRANVEDGTIDEAAVREAVEA